MITRLLTDLVRPGDRVRCQVVRQAPLQDDRQLIQSHAVEFDCIMQGQLQGALMPTVMQVASLEALCVQSQCRHPAI